MIVQETGPTLLLFCILALFFCGLVIFSWGKKLPGKGGWLVWAGFLAVLGGLGIDSGFFFKEGLKIRVWLTGWVWSREEMGAITVGVLQDSLGLMIAAFAILVGGTFLLNHEILSREPHPQKTYAAIAISTAGVALAWNSLTPWLVLAALVMTILGGFITLGSRWEVNLEANSASRFIWERSAGFLVAFFGGCILAAYTPAILLNKTDLWSVEPSHVNSVWLGASLLVGGLFIQLQPFPFFGWVVTYSETSPPIRILLNQVCIAWAAFPLLLRLYPQCVSLGLFPGFGWIALSSAILIIFSGLFQSQWRLGLGAWLSAGLSLVCSALAMNGPFSSMAILIGITLGALCLSCGAVALERKSLETVSCRQRAIWVKVALFLGMASGTGVIGFISATGGIRWINGAWSQPGALALILFSLFLFSLLGWKLAWNILKLGDYTDLSWVQIFSLYIWIFLGLAIFWTGSITGGVVLGPVDQIFGSLFSDFFGVQTEAISNQTDFVSASGLYWGSLILAFATAFWTAGRKDDKWNAFAERFPRLGQFLCGGYGTDHVVSHFANGMIWLGRSADTLIDQKISTEWIPKGLYIGLKNVSSVVTAIDFRISFYLIFALKKLVEVPARFLQLVQTGDVRWYLFLALSSGFILLLHYLKI